MSSSRDVPFSGLRFSRALALVLLTAVLLLTATAGAATPPQTAAERASFPHILVGAAGGGLRSSLVGLGIGAGFGAAITLVVSRTMDSGDLTPWLLLMPTTMLTASIVEYASTPVPIEVGVWRSRNGPPGAAVSCRF